MIIRGVPKNIENYICVDSLTSVVLHSSGFTPKYINGNSVYYSKEICLEKFMEREGLKCQ